MSTERISPLDIKRETEALRAEHLEARKRIVFDTLRTGLRVYLYGLHSDIPKLREEGSDALRVGGQLLANTFRLKSEEASDYAIRLRETEDTWQLSPHLASFIAARLAEGLYESGNKEAGQHLAANLVNDTERPAVEEYFHLSDENRIRSHHA